MWGGMDMSPIERTQERARAAAVLNVSLYATRSELKSAWKRTGFATHPDQKTGSNEAFQEAQAAFELLFATTAPEPSERLGERPTRTVMPRRVSSSLGPRVA